MNRFYTTLTYVRTDCIIFRADDLIEQPSDKKYF